MACSCLHVLKGEDNQSLRNAVAEYMLYHFSKEPEERQQTIMKWMKELLERKALNSKSQFSLPLNRSDDRSDSDGDLPKIQICRGALGHLLDFKDCKWRTMINAVKNDTVIRHGNKGRVSRNSQLAKEVKLDLHKYLENLMEMEGAPQSTGIIELPSNLSMRKLYIRFIEERGWTAETAEKGTVEKSAIPGKEQKEICHWATFHRYWRKEFPKLRTYSHNFGRKRRKKNHEDNNNNDSSSSNLHCLPAIEVDGDDDDSDEDEEVDFSRNNSKYILVIYTTNYP